MPAASAKNSIQYADAGTGSSYFRFVMPGSLEDGNLSVYMPDAPLKALVPPKNCMKYGMARDCMNKFVPTRNLATPVGWPAHLTLYTNSQ